MLKGVPCYLLFAQMLFRESDLFDCSYGNWQATVRIPVEWWQSSVSAKLLDTLQMPSTVRITCTIFVHIWGHIYKNEKDPLRERLTWLKNILLKVLASELFSTSLRATLSQGKTKTLILARWRSTRASSLIFTGNTHYYKDFLKVSSQGATFSHGICFC